jgi:hypothetical protein
MRLAVALALLAVLVPACGGGSDAPTASVSPRPDRVITFVNTAGDEVRLNVEVADTPDERAQGLMGRGSLAEDAGMLFIWPEDSASGFWMKDTLIPLSVAFIAGDGTIVHIEDMEPQDETLHRSPEPFRYAVEVNQGWFEANGNGFGDRVEIGGAE